MRSIEEKNPATKAAKKSVAKTLGKERESAQNKTGNRCKQRTLKVQRLKQFKIALRD